MNFIVIVTCAVVSACPLGGGRIEHHLLAKDSADCHNTARAIIKSLGYSLSDFNIKCEAR